MKGNVKMVLIYLLMLVLFGLIIYLIYFVTTSNTQKKSTKKVKKEVKDEISCEFDVTLDQLNQILIGQSDIELCENDNKLIVSDLVVNAQAMDFYVTYNTDSISAVLNKEEIISTSTDTYNFTLQNNLFYVKSWNTSLVNLLIYNGQTLIYDFSKELKEANITDSVFSTLKVADSTISEIVDVTNIDIDSFVINNTGFTFDTTTNKECQTGQTYKGSTYSVTYNGTFQTPVFVSYVNC